MSTEKQSIRLLTASVDITPTRALELAGYGGRMSEPIGATDRGELEANIVVLSPATTADVPVVLISLDLVYAGDVESMISSRLNDLGHRVALITFASHTHFGPCTDYAMDFSGRVDGEYLDTVTTDISDRVAALLASAPMPALLSYGVTASDHSINRRKQVRVVDPATRTVRHDVAILPNEQGPTDPRLRFIEGRDATTNQVTFVAWSLACHAISHPGHTTLSADYPGTVRTMVRERYGNIPVLFFAGCGGDQRPSLLAEMHPLHRLAAEARARYGRGSRWAKPTIERWSAWARSIGNSLLDGLATSDRHTIMGPVRFAHASQPLQGDPHEREFEAAALHFGDDFVLAGCNAEPMASHADFIAAAYPGKTVLPVGYLGKVWGYLPRTSMLAEGGYEATGHRERFDLGDLDLEDPDAALAELLTAVR